MSQSIWKDGIGKGDGGTAPEAGAGGTFHMPEFGRLESDRKTEVLICLLYTSSQYMIHSLPIHNPPDIFQLNRQRSVRVVDKLNKIRIFEIFRGLSLIHI